ncbi:hypothetical protein GH714_026047 [Hevea brasiliensis]|uniref:non-specific serine/threonine protein kinase n=1 Tax=Hevea brasiliensis TaxID=3981 RepID=A0A6A6LSJ3_HEVBR|nr:hypothetical protein GH714_026047 [Hevea brasiliensis]
MLKTVEASSNRLTGRLPEFLCNAGKLARVVVCDNNRNGELRESLGNCSSLLMLGISRNAFTGNIPVGLWTGLNLAYLMLSDNLFTGELPNEVSRNLRRLEISHNRINCSPLLTTLLLDRNQLIGALPSDIVPWKSLTILNMSQNQLSGHIPQDIGFLHNLHQLYLSNNHFSGQIPPEFSSLKLIFLNLSFNHLAGEIPSSLENIAYNSSFLNNPGLCTRSSFLSLNLCNYNAQKSSKNSTQTIALISRILATAFVLALLLSFFVIRFYQKKKRALNSTWKLTSFQKLDFTESDILSGLIETNLIGSGGSGKVYRVAMHRSSLVAVKRICNDNKLDQKLEKQFHAEVQIPGRIRHLNIVKLLCCICNDDSKLLVYEYMERFSLDQWLHVKKRSTRVSGSVYLDRPTRFRIAMGPARGLSYLHHDCLPPIIHRDVKSSNMLLDSAFNAKIADFGLARLVVKKGETSVSVVAGSFGYIAPEWACRHMIEGRLIVDALDKEIMGCSC